MRKWLLICFLLPVVFIACNRNKIVKIERDISITPVNSVTRLAVDSLQMEQYIQTQKLTDSAAQYLRNFYNSRNFQYAWVGEKGLTEQARVFYQLNKDYVDNFRDSSLLDVALDKKMELLMKEDTTFKKSDSTLSNLELKLTSHFFNYVSTAYEGKVNPEVIQWHIPRKKISAVVLLDSLMAHKNPNPENWEPVNQQYRLLKKELERYYSLQKSGKWAPIPITAKKKHQLGDTGVTVSLVKKRLQALGDSLILDTLPEFDQALKTAVKSTQQQYGFNPTGTIDASLLKALNVPIQKRIEQLLINLERMRWMPIMPVKSILANIPEYQLHVFEDHKQVFSMGIVVGKAANKTVIFSNKLRNIVFSPYWNVPASIVRKEILPAMSRNRNYLASTNMEQIGTSNGLPVIRQKPGDNNSLGRVKFLFPNSYDIYFHDTPAKSLFSEEKRAFSHGCIRLEQPVKLADYLLADQPSWTPERIAKAMKSNKEIWVTLKTPVPVFITYFTAWVDQDGRLNFRDDIYGHDQTMAEQLFLAAK
ncbi:L,D-transpeptidase family protein [Pedobacter gandavensis]|uniref:L,D-transpeptidase family protein n=1 Tax=Pedobacter gandavensis TaxID=2679963 RepID=A0ABR6EZD1_9SPHI|nr:L,D-transpeptidase family protein [Pedobacter gandavensis]MBB2150607.1 L,D-transpeptidase family protein [Pedobacter gandavensis]